MLNFVEELKWRGMIHDIMPGTEECLAKEYISGYVGIDPTADSLHIGHLVSIMMLKHFQNSGHKPIILVGGATGMIGDPSGKSEERNLLSTDILAHNVECIKNQVVKFLDFECKNSATVVNNYEWFKSMDLLSFLRDVGKHITVNYMLAKDSVKKRLETGISFTEFSYQLLQGFDYYYLNKYHNCKLQMGGSDQWGNIVTGTELIRRMSGKDAYAITSPLITKADGGKFGKTEKGNIWLDPSKTSPYQFFQFWLNTSDEDIVKWIKIFSLRTKEEIDDLLVQHNKEPHKRIIQKKLAEELTIRIHSENDYKNALKASEILFGNENIKVFEQFDKKFAATIFEGIPTVTISHADFQNCDNVVDFLSTTTHLQIFSSKSEARKMIQTGGVSINKEKITDTKLKPLFDKVLGNIILVQKGKKNYYIVKIED